MKKITLIIAIFTFVSSLSFAQRRSTSQQRTKAKVEQTLVSCDDINYQDRATLGVVDFTTTASGASRNIGKSMSDMLSNALVECNCFRVVERDRLQKIMEEQRRTGIDPTTAARNDKLVGAQLLVMGNITEFKEKSGGLGGAIGGKIGRKIGVGGIGKTDAHVGMIIKVVNATTGDILISKSLERSVSKVGVAGGGTTPLAVGSLFFKSKAMEDAIEETILEAVALIVDKKDNLPNASGSMANQPQTLAISLQNANFKSLMTVAKFLEDLSYVQDVQKSLSGDVATLNVAHTSSADAMMMDLVDKSRIYLDIVSFNEQLIEIALK